MKKGFLLLLLVLVLAGCNKQPEPTPNDSSTAPTEVTADAFTDITDKIASPGSIIEIDDDGNTVSISNPIPALIASQAEQTYVAKLQPVGDVSGDGSVLAGWTTNDLYLLTATASLPQPSQGYEYQAWISRAKPESNVRTGVMRRSEAGYETIFSSSINYSDHDTIAIMLVPVEDETQPEPLTTTASKVLEGKLLKQ